MSLNKTNIGLLLGDPSGIGPELTVKLLDSDVSEKANILIIGEKKVLEDGQEIVGKKIDLKFVDKFDDVNFDGKTKFFLILFSMVSIAALFFKSLVTSLLFSNKIG